MEVWRCGGVEVWRCGGVQVWRCGGVDVCRCAGVQVCRCAGVYSPMSAFLCILIGPTENRETDSNMKNSSY